MDELLKARGIKMALPFLLEPAQWRRARISNEYGRKISNVRKSISRTPVSSSVFKKLPVAIATGYRLDGSGSIPGNAE